ncbi:hypothetical protein MY10362_000466 [Beauveria mimosiformis]
MGHSKQHPSATIHPTSVIHRDCIIGRNVSIGPFCYIGDDVSIGDNTVLVSHVTIQSSTAIGSNCTIYPQAALGGPPQDKKTAGQQCGLVIGHGVTIRECATIHTGAQHDGNGFTTIGNNCLIMANAHVGHNCRLEDHVVIVTGAAVGGHAFIGKGAVISGQAAVVQWCRVGQLAFVAAGSIVTRDALPFSTVHGFRARPVGVNTEGLRRRGWTPDRIGAVASALKKYIEEGEKALVGLSEESAHASDITDMVNFVLAGSSGASGSESAAGDKTAKL